MNQNKVSKDLFTCTDDFYVISSEGFSLHHTALSVIKMSLAEMNLSFAGCGFMGVYHIGADLFADVRKPLLDN